MHKIIGFYRKIFEQELSKSQQLHLFSNKIVKRLFLSGHEELTNTDHPLIPLSDAKALSFIKELELNGSELELKYFSLARISRFTSFNKYEVTRVYPLISYDAKIIERDENYYVEINLLSREILKSNLKTKVTSLIDFDKLLKNPFTDFHFVSQFADYLAKDNVSKSDELRLFPKLWSGRKISAKIKSARIENDLYIPCASICLVEKPKYAYSTLDELKKIEKANTFSTALNAVFDRTKNNSTNDEGIICEELNFWQQQAIQNSNNKILSVISGPPGTGKSFTIANIAAEKVSKGQSVLISSKNAEALEVIESKIKDNLGIDNLTVNPSKDKNQAHLKDYLKHILGRGYKKKNVSFDRKNKDKAVVHSNSQKLIEVEKEVEDTFELEKEILQKLNSSNFTKHASDTYKKRVIKARGLKTIPLWHKLETYYNLIEKNRTFAIESIQRANSYELEDSIIYHRHDLRTYLNFLRARDANRKEGLYNQLSYKAIIKTFPVWLVKASEIAKVFPRETEMFDFLIIDEASQCDTPSMIPLLQRAKNCIVVGDQNQLGHISFIPKTFESQLKNNIPEYDRHLCNHRDYSFLSLVNDNIDPQNVAYLSEHFRSKHAIIEFSNKEIYKNQLEVLTKRPTQGEDSVELIKLQGINEKSSNLIEIDAILTKIDEIIKKESAFPLEMKTTIGVLSPFRNQVDKLFIAVKKAFTLKQIKEHRLMVGTAFSFQGNERDVMMLSLVVDDNSHAGSYNYINRKDVFNVSVTRARHKQLVYYSFNPKALKFESTLQLFFDFYEKYTSHFIEEVDKNEHCSEIENYIQQFGYETWQQFEVSGVKIDILAQKNNQFIAIDLVGFPGTVGDFYKLERYKMLERGKIKLFPLPYAYWLYDKEFCLEAIEKLCLHN